jgi:hypothetical protein
MTGNPGRQEKYQISGSEHGATRLEPETTFNFRSPALNVMHISLPTLRIMLLGKEVSVLKALRAGKLKPTPWP